MQLRFLLMLFAVLALGIAMSVAHASDENCPEFEKHKCAKPQKLIPTKEQKVCIRGQVAGPATRVTFHFTCDDVYVMPPISRIYPSGKEWHIWRNRVFFERVKACKGKGKIKICAGLRGKVGAVFEERDIVEHLKNGPHCISSPVCLFHGLVCPAGQK